MTDLGKPQLRLLTSGIANLDSILGGGFPEYSFNLIAGDPGSGKTTLCHQIIFANATPEAPALYFTIMGEPPLKMLRYQQQFSFFDPAKVDRSIHFINLSREALDSLDKALEMIVGQVEQRNPAFVVVDSFRSLTETTPQGASGQMNLQMFLQRLALDLTSRQTTAFLVGEYTSDEPLTKRQSELDGPENPGRQDARPGDTAWAPHGPYHGGWRGRLSSYGQAD